MKDRSLTCIIPFVFIAHVLAILWFVSIYKWDPPKPPPKAVVVKTVKLAPPLQPPLPIIALKESPPLSPPEIKPSPELKPPEVKPSLPLSPPQVKSKPKTSPPKPKAAPPPKKQTPPPKPTAEPPKPEEIAQKAAKEKQKNLLSQAKEKLQKVTREISLATPAKIERLQIDALVIDEGAALNVKEAAYSDELAYRLKLMLKLPKYGEVKLRLTVNRSGQVTKVAIISFQSEENKAYLESALPQLNLPAFGVNFAGQEEHTFTILLGND